MVGMDTGRSRILHRAVFLQCCGASPTEPAASMGSAFAWACARPGGGLFVVVHRLYKPRRETPRHEPIPLDNCGRFYSQRSRHHSLLPAAATTAKGLPTMRQCRADRIQLLSPLQLQTGSKLSALPARDWRKRCLLSVLRNFAPQSGCPCVGCANQAYRLTTNNVAP